MAWISSRIVAGMPSIRLTHVSAGLARTASTARPSTTIPNRLKSARPPPALHERIQQHAAELNASRIADGSFLSVRSTARTVTARSGG